MLFQGVAGKIPTASAPLTAYTHALVAGLTGNARVPNPQPPIATLSALLGTFEAAETATVSRTGTVGARNAARAALRSALKTEVATIQAAATPIRRTRRPSSRARCSGSASFRFVRRLLST